MHGRSTRAPFTACTSVRGPAGGEREDVVRPELYEWRKSECRNAVVSGCLYQRRKRDVDIGSRNTGKGEERQINNSRWFKKFR